jgi:hypothetical protein
MIFPNPRGQCIVGIFRIIRKLSDTFPKPTEPCHERAKGGQSAWTVSKGSQDLPATEAHRLNPALVIRKA